MITLIGMGSGTPESLTAQGLAALQNAGLILGAKRLLEQLPQGCTEHRKALYQPEDVLAALAADPEVDAALVYSGDTGFYSGAAQLLPMLRAFGITCRISGCHADCRAYSRCNRCSCRRSSCLCSSFRCNLGSSLCCFFCRLFSYRLGCIFGSFLCCLFCQLLSCIYLLDTLLCLGCRLFPEKCSPLRSSSGNRAACFICKICCLRYLMPTFYLLCYCPGCKCSSSSCNVKIRVLGLDGSVGFSIVSLKS